MAREKGRIKKLDPGSFGFAPSSTNLPGPLLGHPLSKLLAGCPPVPVSVFASSPPVPEYWQEVRGGNLRMSFWNKGCRRMALIFVRTPVLRKKMLLVEKPSQENALFCFLNDNNNYPMAILYRKQRAVVFTMRPTRMLVDMVTLHSSAFSFLF